MKLTKISPDLKYPIPVPLRQLTKFCHKWDIVEFALFGSVLRSDFRPDSDVDVLVSFSPNTTWSLFDFVRMQSELNQLFNRSVDLVDRKSIETSPNYIRRNNILKTIQVIYAA